jgi:pimeloyl-ACP methyl ester carboxylesterase
MLRPLPVLLVHGFNGIPGAWTDSGFRQHIVTYGNLEPSLVRVFRYGAAPDGTYNNRGDLRQIAARLAGTHLPEDEALTSSVDRLSADSVARGGSAQVTLIGHSLGGIICRYYLSRSEPDEFDAVYHGTVGRLITIGAPHRGVDLLRLTELAPRDSVSWRVVRFLEGLGMAPAVPAKAIEAWEADLVQLQLASRAMVVPDVRLGTGRTLLTDAPIVQQIAPDSPLLATLNEPGVMPERVECHALYGDIRVRARVAWGRGAPILLDHEASLGDLAVTTESAATIPGARTASRGFVTEKCLEMTLNQKGNGAVTRSLWEQMPDTAHARLLGNRAVQDTVLALLRND